MEFKSFERYTFYEDKYAEYVQELEKFVAKSKYLPRYHIAPKSGLLNDPNGLCYFGGYYHYFYQWFPFEPTHGMKHWYHLKSKDLLNWSDEGIGINPTEDYERNGAYSGNAFIKDDIAYLFYTANYRDADNVKVPKQAVALMDLDGNIVKSERNPLIDGAPVGFSGEIRDPFVFERDNQLYMLLGAKDLQDKGQLLLYKGSDLFTWEYAGIIDLPVDTGYMVECPSLIEVDGKDVFVMSPMGVEREELRYHNRFATVYLTGYLNIAEMRFELEHMDQIDAGFDFYAPQMYYDKNMQPQMVAWVGCGEMPLVTDKDMWKHGLTMTRTFALEGNELTNFVTDEIVAAFAAEAEVVKDVIQPKNNAYRATITFDGSEEFIIKVGTTDNHFAIKFNPVTGIMEVDRAPLAIAIDAVQGEQRYATYTALPEHTLDIFVDNSFVEIFLDGGKRSFTFRAFNLSGAHEIMLTNASRTTLAYYTGDIK